MKEIIKLKYFVILLLFGFLLLPKSAFALATSVSEMSNEGYSIKFSDESLTGNYAALHLFFYDSFKDS